MLLAPSLALLLVLQGGSPSSLEAAPPKPNVVVLMLDTLRPDRFVQLTRTGDLGRVLDGLEWRTRGFRTGCQNLVPRTFVRRFRRLRRRLCVVHENDGGVMCKAWGDWICVHCLGRHVKILVSNSN